MSRVARWKSSHCSRLVRSFANRSGSARSITGAVQFSVIRARCPSSFLILLTEERQELLLHVARKRFGQVHFNPTLDSTNVGAAAVTTDMEVQVRLTLQIESPSAPILDTVPGAHLTQYVFQVIQPSSVDAGQTSSP
jgi:hypothetical protein